MEYLCPINGADGIPPPSRRAIGWPCDLARVPIGKEHQTSGILPGVEMNNKHYKVYTSTLVHQYISEAGVT